MTDQVTSIEQSKRLIELGVPAEKAIKAFCMDCICASDGKHCSLGNGCAIEVNFIQKLTENEND